MTAVQMREVKTTRREWAVSNPCVHRDLYDALAMAAQAYLRDSGRAAVDDSIHVKSDDDEIVVWYEGADL